MIPQPWTLLLTPDDIPGFFASPELAPGGSQYGYRLRLECLGEPGRGEVLAITSWVLAFADVRSARRTDVRRSPPDGSPVSLPRSYVGVRAWVRPRPAAEIVEYRLLFRQGAMIAELVTESRWLLSDGAAPPDISATLRLARHFARKLAAAQGAGPHRRTRFGRATIGRRGSRVRPVLSMLPSQG